MSSIRWSSDSPAWLFVVLCLCWKIDQRINARLCSEMSPTKSKSSVSVAKVVLSCFSMKPSFSTSRKPGAAILCWLEDQGPTALGWNGHAFQCLSQTCAWASSLRSKPCVKPVPRASPDRNQPLPAQSPQSAMFSTISYHLSRRRPTMKNSECSFLFPSTSSLLFIAPYRPYGEMSWFQ